MPRGTVGLSLQLVLWLYFSDLRVYQGVPASFVIVLFAMSSRQLAKAVFSESSNLAGWLTMGLQHVKSCTFV